MDIVRAGGPADVGEGEDGERALEPVEGASVSGAALEVHLWDALDRPPWDEVIPPVRSYRWARCKPLLRAALSAAGCPWTPRSPNALAHLLMRARGGRSGRGLPTWGEVCHSRTVAQLAAALHARRRDMGAAGYRVASWNVRWLVDPAAAADVAKRETVRTAALEGRIVLLQETHWDPPAEALWAGLFAGCRVLSTPARLGPAGGPQGGAAIIVPPGWDCVEWGVLVPACAVQARLRRRGACEGAEEPERGFLVQSVYFPPDDVSPACEAYIHAINCRGDGGPFLAAGDLNIQMSAPRGPEEERLTTALTGAWTRRGVAVTPGVGPTRRGRGFGGAAGPGRPGESCTDQLAALDVVAAPAGDAWAWATTPSWRPNLSDHALLRVDFRDAFEGRSSDVCSPWAFAALPPAAIQDLRQRFYCLEAAFGVGREGRPDGGREAPAAPPAELARDDPAAAVLHETSAAAEERPGVAGGTHDGPPADPTDAAASVPGTERVVIAPAIAGRDGRHEGPPGRGEAAVGSEPAGSARVAPGAGTAGVDAVIDPLGHLAAGVALSARALRRFGAKFMAAMIKDWWRFWRKRRKGEADLGAELVRLAKRGGKPTPALARWLRDLGCDDEALTKERAAAWAGVWRHQEAARRAGALPGRLAGPGLQREPLPAAIRCARFAPAQKRAPVAGRGRPRRRADGAGGH